ncbi:hypothetical protein TNCT_689401 [Trichonephila clavata]|uniref:Secreted protein n=1 Tax=Trichonephila clavata TaxID=2740835 RepID=A0A8X6K6C7_TRICU|nr:hypothetical protein TNCT_689401 [Trichonephila clavata]
MVLVSRFLVSAAFFLPRPVWSSPPPPYIYAAPAARSPIHGLTCCQVLQCMLNPLPGVGIRSLHTPPKSKISPLWLILPFRTKRTSLIMKQKIYKQKKRNGYNIHPQDGSGQSSLKETLVIL